jgi:5-(aminomethyl)-3-furanmethanol phosphate kinase
VDSAAYRVVKVGGSLLEFDELATRLHWLHTRFSDAPTIYIPGGGPAADIVRTWDEVHGLGEEAAHRLALAAMGLNCRLLASLLPGVRMARSREALFAPSTRAHRVVIDPLAFIESEEARTLEGPLLPHRWAATSDAVAAWVALRVGAAELVLLKPVAPRPGATLHELAASGYVDSVVPELARPPLRVFAGGFRSGSPELVEVPLADERGRFP